MIYLTILLICGFLIIGFFTYESDRHLKWFNSLKEGDHILVRIYSNYCECAREAVVTKPTDGKYITAEILPDVITTCEECALVNSLSDKKTPTCWYNVTMFKKGDVTKIGTDDTYIKLYGKR